MTVFSPSGNPCRILTVWKTITNLRKSPPVLLCGMLLAMGICAGSAAASAVGYPSDGCGGYGEGLAGNGSTIRHTPDVSMAGVKPWTPRSSKSSAPATGTSCRGSFNICAGRDLGLGAQRGKGGRERQFNQFFGTPSSLRNSEPGKLVIRCRRSGFRHWAGLDFSFAEIGKRRRDSTS